MNSIRFVAARNLIRKPLQSTLVAVVLTLSVLLLFTGAGLLREVRGPFERMFQDLKGAHYTLVFDTRVHDASQIREWWLEQPEVASVGSALPMIRATDHVYVRESKVSKPLLVTERPTEVADLDRLRAVQGSIDVPLGPGEVWIPTSVGQEMNANVGDQIQLPSLNGPVPFEIRAIVVDPQFSAPFNSPTRIWVASGELPKHFALSSLNEVVVGVRLQDQTDSPQLRGAFQAFVGGHFNGDLIDYQRVSAGYTAPYQLMAMMLVVFSVLSMLVALLAVQGTVTSSVLADFPLIGLLRTQGFRPVDVRRIYQFQYLMLGIPAILVGVGLAWIVVRQGVALLMRPTGVSADPASLFSLAIWITFISAAFLYFFVGRVARRADLIRPVDAIRFDTDSLRRQWRKRHASQRTGVEKLSQLPMSLIVALRMFVVQRRRVAFSAASIVFATMAAVFAINLDHSFQLGRSDLGLLGFDSADVRLTRGGKRLSIRHEPFMQDLSLREDVLAVSTWDYLDGTLLQSDERPNVHLIGTVLDGDADQLGLRNVQGRHPITAGEISVGVTTARAQHIELGQSVTLLIFGRRLEFEVTGVFQTINNGGTGFRVPLSAVQQSNPLYEPRQYGVVLAKNQTTEKFIETIEAEFGEAVDAEPGDQFIGSMLDGIIGSMRVSNGFLAMVLLAASCIFIFNSTLMGVAENRKTYGILMAIGMTPGQLHRSVVWNLVLQSVIGISGGCLVWWLLGGKGVSLLFTNVGLVSFPLQNHLLGTCLVGVLVFCFCVGSGWWSAVRELRLDPKRLIVE